MNVWRLIWGLARYRLHLYLLSGLFASTLFYLFPLIPGLIVRWFFDTLTGASPAGLNEWSLIALLLGTTVVRAAALLLAGFTEQTVVQIAQARACWSIHEGGGGCSSFSGQRPAFRRCRTLPCPDRLGLVDHYGLLGGFGALKQRGNRNQRLFGDRLSGAVVECSQVVEQQRNRRAISAIGIVM